MQSKEAVDPKTEGHNNAVTKKLISGVNAMHVVNKSLSASQNENHTEGKEQVSFGTNMSTEEEAFDTGLEAQNEMQLTTTIERFHARKFGTKAGQSADKRVVLMISSLRGRRGEQRNKKLQSNLVCRVLSKCLNKKD
jgi:hypothetical protein